MAGSIINRSRVRHGVMWLLQVVVLAFLLHCNNARARFERFGISSLLHGSLVSESGSSNCKDGVCALPGATSDASGTKILDIADDLATMQSSLKEEEASADPDFDNKVSELSKLGWKEDDAKRALKASDLDVGKAADYLETEEELAIQRQGMAKELSEKRYWRIEAAESALSETNYEPDAANKLLLKEEEGINNQFQAAVDDMLSNGWDELVARQALLAQYALDQRKMQGQNTTIEREKLDELRPTLRRSNETQSSTASSGASGAGSGNIGSAGEDNKPTPAKKEDVVFEVTSANFQRLVLESDVPVLVDVYADWCGPCKQLGPVLEQAAINSGGMFRLAKINSDTERAISEALGVTGLPTVFSVSKGQFTDRFVGMLPQDEMQQFMVRAITGYGKRVQNDVSDDDMKEATNKMSSLAGLAAISFKKREKIGNLVDKVVEMDGALDKEGKSMSAALKVGIAYISNAAKDIRDPKKRSISMSSKAYKLHIQGNMAAEALLDVAGFKAVEKDLNGTSVVTLDLVHSNVAILSLVVNRVTDAIANLRYATIKKSAVKLGENPSLRAPSNTAQHTTRTTSKKTEKKIQNTKKAESESKGVIETGIVVSFKGSSMHKKRFLPQSTVKEALDTLLDGAVEQDWDEIEVTFPSSHRGVITRESAILRDELSSFRTGLTFGVVKAPSETTGNGSKNNLKKRKKKKMMKGGRVSLKDYRGKDKSANEFYGGSGTVTLGQEDEDDVEFLLDDSAEEE